MNSWKILVVDDQPEITASLKNQLIADGYEVRIAQTMTEADFLIQRHPFDIAIIDIMLPDGNGIDVYRKLRTKNKDVYTILITGNATIENTITALNEGINAYLVKPFPKEHLKAILLQAEQNLKLKTENKALFQKIQDTRQLYENLLNSTSEAILVVDLDFKIQYCNIAAQRILNQNEEQLHKQLLHQFIDDGYKVLSHIYQQLVLGKPVAGYRVGIKSGSSKSIDAHLSADFLHNQNNHIDGLIITLSNTMIYDELFGRILRKEKLSTIINLANALGHEIRNPINILFGRLQLLAEEMDNDNFTHAFQSIKRQIDRLLQITNLLSKFNFSREDSIPEIILIKDLLQDVVEQMKPQFSRKNIRIDTHYEDRPFIVEGNQAQFTDAFQYLLEALLEFTPEKRAIKIRGKSTNGYGNAPVIELQFFIPEVQITTEQIFDPYQSKEINANSLIGLGMTIMHTIFTNYNAKIESHIQNGKDTLIRIRFPMCDVDTQNSSEKSRTPVTQKLEIKGGGNQ
ncbi:MAG: hypothetical protein Kow0042_25450 [Calditrichia bacterium]